MSRENPMLIDDMAVDNGRPNLASAFGGEAPMLELGGRRTLQISKLLLSIPCKKADQTLDLAQLHSEREVAKTLNAVCTGNSREEAEAHELEKAQRKIKRHQKLSGVEDVTLEAFKVSKDVNARCVMHEKDVIANSLSSSDVDSSSVGSSDDSTSEEEKVSTGFKKVRRAMVHTRVSRDPQLSPVWKEVDETSLGSPTRQHTKRSGEVQDESQMISVSEVVSTLVSQKFERVGIQASGEVGSVESGASSSSKSKPKSLIDAVKWNNVRKKWAT